MATSCKNCTCKTESNLPKVMIGGIFYDQKGYSIIEYLKSLYDQDYPSAKVQYCFVDNSPFEMGFANLVSQEFKLETGIDVPIFEVGSVLTTRMRQVLSYNKLFHEFLKSDCEFLWIVESDLFPHKYTLKMLLENDKDLTSSVYWIGLDESSKAPCWTTDLFNVNVHPCTGKGLFGSVFSDTRNINGRLHKVNGGCGFGCILIKRKVIERYPKVRCGDLHADTYFHEDIEQLGFECYIDTRIVTRHDPSEYANDW